MADTYIWKGLLRHMKIENVQICVPVVRNCPHNPYSQIFLGVAFSKWRLVWAAILKILLILIMLLLENVLMGRLVSESANTMPNH